MSRERSKAEKVYSLKDNYTYEGVEIGQIRQTDGWNNFDITKDKVIVDEEYVLCQNKKIKIQVCHTNSKKENKACMIYFHGGGFVSGSIEVTKNICKAIAGFGDAVVVNVDYSLAPEYKYPIAIEEGFKVIDYIRSNAGRYKINLDNISVCGDSAGGNIAGGIAVRDSKRNKPVISKQVLIYPMVVADIKSEMKNVRGERNYTTYQMMIIR